MNREKKKKRRVLPIIFVVLAVILAAAVAVFLWQKNNIEALKLYMSQSREDIESQISENDAYVDELLEKILNDARGHETDFVSESTEASDTYDGDSADTEALENVGIDTEAAEPPSAETDGTNEDEDESFETLPPMDDDGEETDAVTEGETQKIPEETTAVTSDYEAELQLLVNKVYELRKEYISELDALYAEAVAAYKAIPKAERTTKRLATFASEYVSKGTALERECDGKMDSIVKEFRTLLKKYGKSTEIINEVKLAYAREKSLKKALYMSELERRGFI